VARPVREQDDIGHVLSMHQVQNFAGDVLASFGVLDNNPLATHFGKVRDSDTGALLSALQGRLSFSLVIRTVCIPQ
jgi:hypothetical protein